MEDAAYRPNERPQIPAVEMCWRREQILLVRPAIEADCGFPLAWFGVSIPALP
jgi:hypothetical protein